MRVEDPSVGLVLGEKISVRLVHRIGEGGMGAVYLAESTTSGLPYAVKLLQPRLCQREGALRRFFREATIASSIRHPGVVSVVDTGRLADGSGYYVMELLTGEDLATTLRREGRLAWSRVRHMALQICDAMAVVHVHDVVHRDLKPANCFRTVRGADPDAIKILDFGVAKIAAEDGSVLTGADAFLGTVPYMAPELLRAGGAREGDARGDIWALAVTIQELLTGARPHRADNVFALISAIQEDPPAPLAANEHPPDWPDALQAVLERALARDPQRRFPDMHAFAVALRGLAEPVVSSRTTIVAADPLAATAQRTGPAARDAPPDDDDDDATPPATPRPTTDEFAAAVRTLEARSGFYVDPASRWRPEPVPLPGGAFYAVVRGDLCRERVDAIVCGVDREGLQPGTLAWRLCEFGGPEVATIAERLPGLADGAVCSVPGGRLPAGQVFFVALPGDFASPPPRKLIARAVAEILDRRFVPTISSLSVPLFLPRASGVSRRLVLEVLVKAFARQLAISPPFTLGTLRVVIDDQGERMAQTGGDVTVHLPGDLAARYATRQRFALGAYKTSAQLAAAIWALVPEEVRPPLERYGTSWSLVDVRTGQALASDRLFADERPQSSLAAGAELRLVVEADEPSAASGALQSR